MAFGNAQGFIASGVASAAFPLLAPDGTAAAPSYANVTTSGLGMYFSGPQIRFAVGSSLAVFMSSSDGGRITAYSIGLDPTTTDVILLRDAANTLAQKNGANAQEFRVYGTTTGPKYCSLLHNGTNAQVGAQSGNLDLLAGNSARWIVAGSGGGFTANGNFRFAHGTSALATNATEGFFHLQSCAGAPSGTPASIPTGQVPIILDSTNKKFYAYLGGAWTKAQAGGVDVIFA